MKRLLLIARREYLSYVATWGFWLSLAMAPVFIAVGFSVPALLQRAAPERPFTVVTAEPQVIEAIDMVLAERRASAAGQILAMLAETEAGPDAAEAVRGAFAAGAGPAEAARAAGLPREMAEEAERRVRREYVRVPPPANTPDALRPYLAGETPVPGWRDGVALHAAVVVRRGADGRLEADYWSANLTNPSLRNAVAEALGRAMRDEALAAAGLDPEMVRAVSRPRAVIRDYAPGKEEGAEEVTMADRLPFIVGVISGFILWSAIFSVANMLLTSTIEEKSGKVLEVLLSSARLPEILGGKLLGVAGVSFTLLGVWFIAGASLLALAAANMPGDGPAGQILGVLLQPGLVAPFLFYFVMGYLIYGAAFLAVGSLCETMQEAQTLMSPMVLMMMAPILLLGFSIANLDSPFIAGASWFPLFTPFLMMARLPLDPPLWEILGTSALMLATLAFMIWGGARVFRAGALGQARPGSLKSLMKAFRRA